MTTIEKLQCVFQDVLDDPSIQLTSELSPLNYPDWDSVATVRLILSIESEFGIRFTTDQVAEIKSVQNLLTVLETQ